jgi:hypothetical protein
LNFVLIFSRTGFLEEILKRQWDCL